MASLHVLNTDTMRYCHAQLFLLSSVQYAVKITNLANVQTHHVPSVQHS